MGFPINSEFIELNLISVSIFHAHESDLNHFLHTFVISRYNDIIRKLHRVTAHRFFKQI